MSTSAVASEINAPNPASIQTARTTLADYLPVTPVWELRSDRTQARFGASTQLIAKLELFQRSGSFKTRGALMVMLAADSKELERGVTAVSAGNHAIALSYAARLLGVHAKVVMPRSASRARIDRVRELGAELVLVDNVHEAFDTVRAIERDEGRLFVHPFEGPHTALGTATLGAELVDQAGELDAVIVPIGGGGLAAGVAAAVKQLRPGCQVIGVEPFGADSMTRSFAAGSPQSIECVTTIADSLGAPHAAPYSFELCRRFIDKIVRVDDEQLCHAMALLFNDLKLACEPAGAAATAAAWHVLADELRGKRVGLIICGSNIDSESFHAYVRRGEEYQVSERQ